MESVLHTMYVVAIKDTAVWAGYGPADLSMIGLWNLIVVWLKVGPCPDFSHDILLTSVTALDPLAFLPTMGATGWDGSAGEHDSLCVE